MNNESKYYQPSGKIGLLGPVYMAVIGFISSVVLSIIYGKIVYYFMKYISIYINILLPCVLGGAIGFSIGMAGKWGKIRNIKILIIYGLIFGALGEYVGWMAYLDNLGGTSPVRLWSIFGITPYSWIFYIIWVIEAVMIIGTSAIAATIMLETTPFCEDCNRWVTIAKIITPLAPITAQDQLINDLENGDFNSLMSLNLIDGNESGYTKIQLSQCTQCKKNNYLTITSVTQTRDKEGNVETSETDIIENLIITVDDYNMLKDHWNDINHTHPSPNILTHA